MFCLCANLNQLLLGSSRIQSSRHPKLPACAAFSQQHSGELDSSREPRHRGQRLHYWLWYRQSSCSDYKSGLQTAILQHWEPRWVSSTHCVSVLRTSHLKTDSTLMQFSFTPINNFTVKERKSVIWHYECQMVNGSEYDSIHRPVVQGNWVLSDETKRP